MTAEMTVPWFETRLPTLLSNYSLADIYSADEFGLFFQALPKKRLHLKNEKYVGGKFSKVTLIGLWWFKSNGPVFSATQYQPMDQGVIRSLKAKYHSQMIQIVIKAIDAQKQIPKISVLDAMKLLVLFWEDVTEEIVQNCFAKAGISTNDQDDLDDPFIDLRSSI